MEKLRWAPLADYGGQRNGFIVLNQRGAEVLVRARLVGAYNAYGMSQAKKAKHDFHRGLI
jgi:hypothetical protein